MPKVNEAIGLVRLVRLPVVHDQVQIVEPALVVLLKVSLDVLLGVPAWNITDHKVRPVLVAV